MVESMQSVFAKVFDETNSALRVTGGLSQTQGDARYAQLAAANTFTVGGHVITIASAAVVGLTVKGAASQTGDLQQYKDSAGTTLASVSATAAVLTAAGSEAAPGLSFQGDPNSGFRNPAADTIGLVLNGVERIRFETVDFRMRSTATLSWASGATSTASDTQFSRAAAGQILADLLKWKAVNEQTTVGAAGGASALPATPTKYLKIVDSAGTTLIVPAYAAT